MASDLYNRIQLPYFRDDGPQGILTPAPKIVPGRDGVMTPDPNSTPAPSATPLYSYIGPDGRRIVSSTPPPVVMLPEAIAAPAVSAPASAFSFGGIQLSGTQLLIGAAILYFLMTKK